MGKVKGDVGTIRWKIKVLLTAVIGGGGSRVIIIPSERGQSELCQPQWEDSTHRFCCQGI